jgi:NAD(P)-dependent dehydrogenase (short-subunit alcohol dehydrogenase family)
VNREAGEATVAQVERLGGEGLMLQADVSDSSECRRVVEATVERFRGVDILFNNVGIQPPASYVNVEDTPETLWDRIIGVNLKSCFLMSKYAIPEMRKRGGGVIISTASVQGLQSQPLVPPYAASKGGILSLTRQMSLDYAKDNIRVLAVCPGSIDTPMLRAAAGVVGGDPDEVVSQWGAAHPIGRVGTGQDIANAVLFLASDKASFMTGENVNVDGGYMALGAWATAARD